jgi:hypothetical protein
VANFQRIIELFAQKIFTKLSKIWVWDPDPDLQKFHELNSNTLTKKPNYVYGYSYRTYQITIFREKRHTTEFTK